VTAAAAADGDDEDEVESDDVHDHLYNITDRSITRSNTVADIVINVDQVKNINYILSMLLYNFFFKKSNSRNFENELKHGL